MFLDVGNIGRIDDPSSELIGYHLRHLPSQAPFLILVANEELFIQATPKGVEYRVELRQGKLQRYGLLPLDRVDELFRAFRRWDESVIQAVAWNRLSIWNDPYSKAALFILLVVMIVLAFWALLLQWLFSSL